jgi:hypothetical protein
MSHVNRTITDPALGPERAAKRAPTLPSQAETGKLQEWYPAFTDLSWEDIEQYLKRKWPHWTNFNPTRVTKSLPRHVHPSLTNTFRAQIYGSLRYLKGSRRLPAPGGQVCVTKTAKSAEKKRSIILGEPIQCTESSQRATRWTFVGNPTYPSTSASGSGKYLSGSSARC